MAGKLLDDAFIAELAEMVRHKRRKGLWGNEGRESPPAFDAASILVKNTESEEIPAWACMQVNDGAATNEDSRNYVQVKKPTATGINYLFNGPRAIPASGYGVAQSGPIFNAYKSGTITTGLGWSPTVGQWYLSQGASGPFYTYGTNTGVMDSDIILVSRLKENPVANWQWNPHSSVSSADYPQSSSDGTFGTEVVNRYGDFRSLGIDFVSDTDTTTATCSYMRFNRIGTYLMHVWAPFRAKGATLGTIVESRFEINTGNRTPMSYIGSGGRFTSVAHADASTTVSVSWTQLINITSVPKTFKWDIYATGSSGRRYDGYTYNGHCILTKLDTMPSTTVYHQ